MVAMSYAKRILLIAAALLWPQGPAATAERPPLADLLAAEVTKTGLNLTVPTGGCTRKSDFEITASPIKHGAAVLEVRRLERDRCQGNFRDGLNLAFSWTELKLPENTNVSIKNLINRPSQEQKQARPLKRHKSAGYVRAFDRRSHLGRCWHRKHIYHHRIYHRRWSKCPLGHHAGRDTHRHRCWRSHPRKLFPPSTRPATTTVRTAFAVSICPAPY